MSEEKPPTDLVAGKYKLTRLLGRGGMGSVWEGVHTTLGNRVACKFIEPQYVSSADALSRFENEARAAASLKSKHVVDVYDHGVTPDGIPYIVMEFLAGESLDSRIEKRGALPLAQAAVIIGQVSRALARAHKIGIIHRDLKPENVFLVWDDEDQTDIAKVVDFGIAKFTESGSSGISSATKTGALLGTPYFMSPEQARGLKSVDARSDNWSLGIIAYEAITGRRPFDGESVGDLLVRICTTDPAPPSELIPSLPAALDEWMAKALNRDPDHRFQDVREMAEALISIAGLPGRGTLGSAVAAGETEADRPNAEHRVPVKTENYPKATSGALTHGAVETTVTMPLAGLPRRSSALWYVAAAVVIAGVAGAIAMAGDKPAPTADAAPPGESPTQDVASKPAVGNDAPREVEAPEPQVQAAPTPTPPPAPEAAPIVRENSAASPRPATSRPRPSPTPAPAATPAAAPKPAPRPAPGSFDLGY
jgi:serine/threonine-protein kinase